MGLAPLGRAVTAGERRTPGPRTRRAALGRRGQAAGSADVEDLAAGVDHRPGGRRRRRRAAGWSPREPARHRRSRTPRAGRAAGRHDHWLVRLRSCVVVGGAASTRWTRSSAMRRHRSRAELRSRARARRPGSADLADRRDLGVRTPSSCAAGVPPADRSRPAPGRTGGRRAARDRPSSLGGTPRPSLGLDAGDRREQHPVGCGCARVEQDVGRVAMPEARIAPSSPSGRRTATNDRRRSGTGGSRSDGRRHLRRRRARPAPRRGEVLPALQQSSEPVGAESLRLGHQRRLHAVELVGQPFLPGPASSSTFAFDRSPASAAETVSGMWARFRASGTRPLAADRRCSHFSASQVPVDTEPSVVHSSLAVALSHHRRRPQREQRLDPLELDQRVDQAQRPTPPAGRRALPRSLGSGSLTAMRRRYQPTGLNTTYSSDLFVQFDARTSTRPETERPSLSSDTYRHHKARWPSQRRHTRP